MGSDLRKAIFAEVETERAYQVDRWGTEADDTRNRPNDWIGYICHYATEWYAGRFFPYPKGTGHAFRAAMVKVAATAIAAIESHDRQVAAKGKPFYEKA